MNYSRILILNLLVLSLVIQSCNKKNSEDLSTSQKKAIISAAREVVQNVFDASNNLNFIDGLNYYVDAPDAFYTNNGTVLSFDELKTSYEQIGPYVEILENKIDDWNAIVLSENVVAFTLPIYLRIKLKNKPEYNGQLVWSGLVQKRNGEWKIVQSHESWLNCVEANQMLQ